VLVCFRSTMTEEIEYFENKRPDRTYISKGFLSPNNTRRKRFISKVFDHNEHHEIAEIKDELVIRVTEGKRDEVKAIFYEDERDIASLIIQRFVRKTGKPYQKISFSFHGEELKKLYQLIRLIAIVPLEDENKARLDDEVFDEIFRTIGTTDRRKLLVSNADLVLEIVRNNITSSDIVALAYRKGQLSIFRKLLDDQDFFAEKRKEWGKNGTEAVWQRFLEENPWIFGYGLQYVYTTQLEGKKLEQVVSGFSVAGRGKRTDALLKTLGAISSLCLVELKTHKTPLLAQSAYRAECWRVSSDVAGAVAQIQKTVHKAAQTIRDELPFYDEIGERSLESAYLFHPKSFVVVGDLHEFVGEHGVNQQKYSSFELFRRNLSAPEIITFDELFERAKCIVQHSEAEGQLLNAKGEPLENREGGNPKDESSGSDNGECAF